MMRAKEIVLEPEENSDQQASIYGKDSVTEAVFPLLLHSVCVKQVLTLINSI